MSMDIGSALSVKSGKQNILTSQQVRMLSKCANPECSTRFLYMRGGKLFRWDQLRGVKDAGTSSDFTIKKGSHRVEFFWLCDQCAPKMTVVFRKGVGITTKPLASRLLKLAS